MNTEHKSYITLPPVEKQPKQWEIFIGDSNKHCSLISTFRHVAFGLPIYRRCGGLY